MASTQSDSPCVNDRGEHVGSDAWFATQDKWAADRDLPNGGRHMGASTPSPPKAHHPTPSTSQPATTPPATTGGPAVSGFDSLTEAPNTDAEHLENVSGLAEQIQQMADQLEEYISQCQSKGMDDEALDAAKRCAEQLGEAASEASNMAGDFENHYSGVREHAAAHGQVMGDDGPVDFWSGEGR